MFFEGTEGLNKEYTRTTKSHTLSKINRHRKHRQDAKAIIDLKYKILLNYRRYLWRKRVLARDDWPDYVLTPWWYRLLLKNKNEKLLLKFYNLLLSQNSIYSIYFLWITDQKTLNDTYKEFKEKILMKMENNKFIDENYENLFKLILNRPVELCKISSVELGSSTYLKTILLHLIESLKHLKISDIYLSSFLNIIHIIFNGSKLNNTPFVLPCQYKYLYFFNLLVNIGMSYISSQYISSPEESIYIGLFLFKYGLYFKVNIDSILGRLKNNPIFQRVKYILGSKHQISYDVYGDGIEDIAVNDCDDDDFPQIKYIASYLKYGRIDCISEFEKDCLIYLKHHSSYNETIIRLINILLPIGVNTGISNDYIYHAVVNGNIIPVNVLPVLLPFKYRFSTIFRLKLLSPFLSSLSARGEVRCEFAILS